MIQAVIARLNSNSFSIKALTGGISAASLAFAGAAAEPAPWFPLAAAGVVLVLWLLDAQTCRMSASFVRYLTRCGRDAIKVVPIR